MSKLGIILEFERDIFFDGFRVTGFEFQVDSCYKEDEVKIPTKSFKFSPRLISEREGRRDVENIDNLTVYRILLNPL